MGNLKVGEVVQLPALVKVFAHYHLWIVCLWHGRCCAQALEEALFPFFFLQTRFFWDANSRGVLEICGVFFVSEISKFG